MGENKMRIADVARETGLSRNTITLLYRETAQKVDLEAKNVHFTTGGPWFKDWRPRGEIEGKYAVEWCGDADWLKMKGIIKMDKDYMI